MSANTLAKPSTFVIASGFGIEPIKYKKDNGNIVFERVAVFRSGTFRDSRGELGTWDRLHIQQMIDNWNHLRNNKLFEDVPVRDGHKGWLIADLPGNGEVVGWHTDLVREELEAPHDGQKYDYLLANYEITDENAKVKVASGTWRNRSAEVGIYRSNDESEFWPVYMGFAYVDIPAVEGLKFSNPNDGRRLYFMIDKEISVGDNPTTAPGQQPSTAGVPASQPAAVLPFAGRDAVPHVFAVNGAQVSDYGAVQNHILTLEQFRRDTLEQNRKDFVTGLASANKIAATQVDALQGFAVALSPEQFEAWKQTFESAPVQSVLGQHGNTVTNPNNTAQQTDAQRAEAQHSIWRDTVKAHKQAGMPVDKIKETGSYKNLVAAGQTVQL